MVVYTMVYFKNNNNKISIKYVTLFYRFQLKKWLLCKYDGTSNVTRL